MNPITIIWIKITKGLKREAQVVERQYISDGFSEMFRIPPNPFFGACEDQEKLIPAVPIVSLNAI